MQRVIIFTGFLLASIFAKGQTAMDLSWAMDLDTLRYFPFDVYDMNDEDSAKLWYYSRLLNSFKEPNFLDTTDVQKSFAIRLVCLPSNNPTIVLRIEGYIDSVLLTAKQEGDNLLKASYYDSSKLDKQKWNEIKSLLDEGSTTVWIPSLLTEGLIADSAIFRFSEKAMPVSWDIQPLLTHLLDAPTVDRLNQERIPSGVVAHATEWIIEVVGTNGEYQKAITIRLGDKLRPLVDGLLAKCGELGLLQPNMDR